VWCGNVAVLTTMPANAGDWVEALDGMRLENRMGSNGFSIAADARPSGEKKKASERA